MKIMNLRICWYCNSAYDSNDGNDYRKCALCGCDLFPIANLVKDFKERMDGYK